MRSHVAAQQVVTGLPVHDGTLPVGCGLEALFPEGGLTRGRVVACTGPAGTSLALAAVAEAVRAGSWTAAISLPEMGVDAAIGLGLDPRRLVRVDLPDPARWAEVVAASLDGFDLVITAPPPRLGVGTWRKVATRVRSAGAVLVAVGEHRVATGDVTLRTHHPKWTWARAGSHLLGRRVQVTVTGRRVPRPRHEQLWLPAPGGVVEPVEARPRVAALDERPAAPPDPVLDRQAG